ncbi:MAG: fructosamine kinase family protein [Myxococcota bacterium]
MRADPVRGGAIARAWRVQFADGRRFFAKTLAASSGDFAAEAEGLRALAAVGVLRVPRVVAHGAVEDTGYLVLRWIASGQPASDYDAQLGRALAHHHLAQPRRGASHLVESSRAEPSRAEPPRVRPPGASPHRAASAAKRCGYDHDNYLGATPQPNRWGDDWSDFWRERRLGHQWEIARAARPDDRELLDAVAAAMAATDRLLASVEDEPMSLLHGDLWSGNVIADGEGVPTVIDPAVYYGHREADFGMFTLFGGFGDAFLSAYQEVWPFAPGWRARRPLYALYQALNHLHLFGDAYRGRCLELARRVRFGEEHG